MVGTLPEAFHKLDALTMLDMSGCALSGTIPEFVSDTVHGGDVGPVKYLDLSDNRLSGTLPPGIGSLSASLTCVLQVPNQATVAHRSLSFQRNGVVHCEQTPVT